MPQFDIDSLLAPLAADAPCGNDLEYDSVFQALLEAAAGKPERQYGATIIPAVLPDWPVVRSHALALAVRTRDLRVAVWLARSAAHTDGLPGLVQALQLLKGLVEKHWEQVHPRPDAQDLAESIARLSALAPLTHAHGLADFRCAALTPGRPGIKVRDIELAFGSAAALADEMVPTRAGLAPAIAAAEAQSPQLEALMQAGHRAVLEVAELLDAKLGKGLSPDLSPLEKLMKSVADAAGASQGAGAGSMLSQPGVGTPQPLAGGSAADGAIRSREDAMRTLDRVSEWIERHEPTNPAPLLIHRAKRLMTKNFMEIIRDLAPDSFGQVEKLAGPKP